MEKKLMLPGGLLWVAGFAAWIIGVTVQGDTGHASPKMVTEQYSRIRDLDRRRLAGLMDQAYFGRKKVPQTTPDEDAALSMLRENPEVTTVEVVEITGLTLAGVNWNIRKLKEHGKLRRVGARRGGHWEVIE